MRQGDFIGRLAETGSVAEAARWVGMSRQSAYELRTRPGAEGFAAAWDVALGLPLRKVTVSDLSRLAYDGTIRPIMRGGRYRGTVHKPVDSALLRLLDRLDRAVLRRTGRIHGDTGTETTKPRECVSRKVTDRSDQSSSRKGSSNCAASAAPAPNRNRDPAAVR